MSTSTPVPTSLAPVDLSDLLLIATELKDTLEQIAAAVQRLASTPSG